MEAAGRTRILFLCTGNSCRSQMAEGWARHLKGDSVEAHSAGVIAAGLDPRAVRVMAEAGVDISGGRSKLVTEFRGETFDYMVTLCDYARASCPSFPGAGKYVHRGFEDPPSLATARSTSSGRRPEPRRGAAGAASEEEALDIYRRVRDEIRRFVEGIPGGLEEEGPESFTPGRRP